MCHPAPCSLYLGCEDGSPAQQQLQLLLHTNTSILPTMKRLMADFQVKISYNTMITVTLCYCCVQETSASPATRVQLATALFHASDAEIKTEFQKLMRKYFQVL